MFDSGLSNMFKNFELIFTYNCDVGKVKIYKNKLDKSYLLYLVDKLQYHYLFTKNT